MTESARKFIDLGCDGHAAFNRLVRGRGGHYLYNGNDRFLGRSLELYGEFSHLEWMVLSQLAKPGDVVLEVGANIGAHTVNLARAVGHQGCVHAFEPQRICFQTLCANVALNSLLNVHCHHLAVGEAAGQVRVPPLDYTAPNNFGGLSVLGATEGEPVAKVALDQFLELDRLALVKIDVEGMEKLVLQGMTGLIDRFKPVIYVENDRVESSEELIRFLTDLGYRMYWHGPPLFNPDNFFRNPENVFGNIISVNMLCLPASHRRTLQNFAEVTDPAFHPMAHRHRAAGKLPVPELEGQIPGD